MGYRRQKSTDDAHQQELDKHAHEVQKHADEVDAARKNLALERDKQRAEQISKLHDRYAQAVEQLADDKVTIRLGGVYVLAALAEDWRARDNYRQQQVCVDMLCSYLRSAEHKVVESESASGEASDQIVDATVSRLITGLAADGSAALSAINSARAIARETAWSHAGEHAPNHDIDPQQPLIVDVDATLVTAHSEKENTAPNFKRGFGFHPLLAFADHGPDGTGEPLSFLLRPGNAGSNTAADHISVTRAALAQLPFRTSGAVGKKILIRSDGAGGTHAFLEYLTARKLSYSVGFTLTDSMAEAVDEIPEDLWISALDSNGDIRGGAWVAELTGLVHLSGWPAGMRLIVRKERPHPGAQLRFTDRNGLRLTAFVTNTAVGSLQTLELRHRRRARCEDRIRTAKDTGLTNLPLHGFAQNQIWLAIVALASELTAWMQMLALTSSDARRWEPKRLRLRLFSITGRIARHARKTHLRLSKRAPWSGLITSALARLEALPAPT